MSIIYISSVQFSRSVMSDSLWPHELQHARPPCPSPTPRVHPNPCPLSQWCHPTISSPAIPLSSCLQSFPASRSFPMSQFFASVGQRTGASASASVLSMNIQGWFPLGWTGLISLQSKGLWRVFSNTTVQKHQFFGAQLSLWSNSEKLFPVVMYGCESWTIKKVEHQRTDAFEVWCWRRLLRVPWTARRSNQFILKEISPEYSLEGLMLKLKL